MVPTETQQNSPTRFSIWCPKMGSQAMPPRALTIRGHGRTGLPRRLEWRQKFAGKGWGYRVEVASRCFGRLLSA
jgi:hypothetical protein